MSDGCQNYDKGQSPQRTRAKRRYAEAPGLDDALRITIKISEEYSRLCSVMHSMPFRRSELKAGERFMDALEHLRDELLKRKSSNDQAKTLR